MYVGTRVKRNENKEKYIINSNNNKNNNIDNILLY